MSVRTVALIAVCYSGAALVRHNVAAPVGYWLPVLAQSMSVWLVYRAAPELRFGVRDASIGRLRRVLSFSSSLFVMNAAAS